MFETQFFGKLLPANPEIQEILDNIRKKYDLPEIEEGDDPLESYLFEEVDRDTIYQDIREGALNIDGLINEGFRGLYEAYKLGEENIPVPTDYLGAAPEYQEKARKNLTALIKMLTINFIQLDKMIDQISLNAFYYLTTGGTLPVGENWFGDVFTTQFNGEPAVVAIASAVADLRAVIGKFRGEHEKHFGKQIKMTKGRLNSADHLRVLSSKNKPTPVFCRK